MTVGYIMNNTMNKTLIVRKLNLQRIETWRYPGRLLERGPNWLTIEAHFNRPDTPFHGILLGQGDRFVETFYTERWYNIFEIHDRQDDYIKGWYCNICLPAELEDGAISYVDLALDLLVYPDGRQLTLDEDEFEALRPDTKMRGQALTALAALQDLFRRRFST